ncbi:hypothetical protein EYF80_016639 [Liparis tanakae]|uniref:Uncharacterized protein n=1 Tax=Liparis tanakae TaxID=230148 RepID=A0A4Z2I7K6_9TELE|nr:hypothetical protein EYF80_016639 [Liparis tanakae]
MRALHERPAACSSVCLDGRSQQSGSLLTLAHISVILEERERAGSLTSAIQGQCGRRASGSTTVVPWQVQLKERH